jgi:hypothetical protein
VTIGSARINLLRNISQDGPAKALRNFMSNHACLQFMYQYLKANLAVLFLFLFAE